MAIDPCLELVEAKLPYIEFLGEIGVEDGGGDVLVSGDPLHEVGKGVGGVVEGKEAGDLVLGFHAVVRTSLVGELVSSIVGDKGGRGIPTSDSTLTENELGGGVVVFDEAGDGDVEVGVNGGGEAVAEVDIEVVGFVAHEPQLTGVISDPVGHICTTLEKDVFDFAVGLEVGDGVVVAGGGGGGEVEAETSGEEVAGQGDGICKAVAGACHIHSRPCGVGLGTDLNIVSYSVGSSEVVATGVPPR